MTQPEDILKEWIQGVNDGALEKVIDLYNENAVLIPTFSNRILNTPEKIKNYFEKLVLRDELSVTCHDKTIHTQLIAGSIYSISGIYCWRFAVDEEMLSFEARFSFLVDTDLQNPVLNHHSSQIPRTL